MTCRCGCKRKFELDQTQKGGRGQNKLFFSKECGQRYRAKLAKQRGRTISTLAFGKPDLAPKRKGL